MLSTATLPFLAVVMTGWGSTPASCPYRASVCMRNTANFIRTPLTEEAAAINTANVITAPNTKEAVITQLTSVEEFESRLRECPTVAVVKFYKQNCRLCRAVAPKIEQLARDFHGRAEFFAVDLSTGSQVFSREQVGIAPSIIAYSGPVGRVLSSSDLAASGVSNFRSGLDHLLCPQSGRVAALHAVTPASLRPLMRYIALVGVLRGLSNARLSPSPCQAADLDKLRPKELAEIHSTFAALDRDADGLVTADDLVAATQALTPHECPANQRSGSTMIAPSRLAACGIAFELEHIEATMRALCSADACAGDTCADMCAAEASTEKSSLAPPAMGFATFAHMMARAFVEERSKRQKGDPLSRQLTVNAAYTALDCDGDQAVGIERVVGTLEAMRATFPERHGEHGGEWDGELDGEVGGMDSACPAQAESVGVRAAFEAFRLGAEAGVDRSHFTRMATRPYSY